MDKLKKISIIGLAFLLLSILMTAMVSAYYEYDYTPVDEGFFLGLSALICGIIVVIWIVWLVLAIWVYKDAESRGMSGALWALIVFFLGLIGLIIYILVRSSSTGPQQQQPAGTGRVCPACGRPIPMDAQVCPYCGKDFRVK
jgi:hypothetical protein